MGPGIVGNHHMVVHRQELVAQRLALLGEPRKIFRAGIGPPVEHHQSELNHETSMEQVPGNGFVSLPNMPDPSTSEGTGRKEWQPYENGTILSPN